MKTKYLITFTALLLLGLVAGCAGTAPQSAQSNMQAPAATTQTAPPPATQQAPTPATQQTPPPASRS